MLTMLRNKFVILFSILVGLQGIGGYYLNARQEYVPRIQPLRSIPTGFSGWSMIAEYPMEKEIQDVLKATDTVSRTYVRDGMPVPITLFIAFFQTQRNGVAPHSPKNCLPGNGWVPERNQIIHLPVAGRQEPVEVNQYVVQRGDTKNVVLYWYHSHGRVVASEYKAKMYVVADAVTKNRTDTSLVKIIAPVANNDVDGALRAAHQYIHDVFPVVSLALPN